MKTFGFGDHLGDFTGAEEGFYRKLCMDYSKKLRDSIKTNMSDEERVYNLAYALLLCADGRPEDIEQNDKNTLQRSIVSLESKLSHLSTE